MTSTMLRKILTLVILFFCLATSGVYADNAADRNQDDALGKALSKAIDTAIALPSSLFPECQAEFNNGKPDVEENSQKIVGCAQNIIQVIFVVSILFVVVQLVTSNLGVILKSGEGSTPVQDANEKIRNSLIGLFLIGGMYLVISLFAGNIAGINLRPIPIADVNVLEKQSQNADNSITSRDNSTSGGFVNNGGVREVANYDEYTGFDFQSPMPGAAITTLFGYDPNYKNGDSCIDGCVHAGIDMDGGEAGVARVLSIGDGTVVGIGSGGTLGNYIIIEHENSDKKLIYSMYAHLFSKPTFAYGTKVSKGQEIGKMGNTGLSVGGRPGEPYPGAHLHLQLIDNSYQPSNSNFDRPGSNIGCKIGKAGNNICLDPMKIIPGL